MACPGRSYTVVGGDTLVLIAQRFLGDGTRWGELTKPDGTSFTEAEAENLQIGQVVCIPGQSVVTIYEDADFQGNSAALGVGRYDWGQLGIANDSLSSLKVPTGMTATLYEDTHFAGRSKTFTQDASYVGNDFNDITSSIVVTAGSTPGTISVQDVDFTLYSGGGDINAWIAQACQAAGLPLTDAWVKGFQTLCFRESSNKPNAVNTTDSNATGPIVADGHPQNCSRGVAQCIPPTFAAYHVAGTSVAIYDPVANIAAASRYIRDRYQVSLDGSDFAAKVQQADPSRPPHGY